MRGDSASTELETLYILPTKKLEYTEASWCSAGVGARESGEHGKTVQRLALDITGTRQQRGGTNSSVTDEV